MIDRSDQSTPTAAVVPIRTDETVQVLWARRPAERSFLGGFHAFVAGRVRPSDSDVPVRGGVFGRYAAAAAREVFEEAGVLVTCQGLAFAGGDDIAAPRGAVATGLVTFADLLAREGRTVDGRAFVPLGRWPTPSRAPIETRTEFFALELDEGPLDRLPDRLDEREHLDPEWIRPTEALDRWTRGRALLSPPIQSVLAELAERGWSSHAPPRLPPSNRRVDRELFEPIRNLRTLPQRTPTLPPARETNTHIVGRRGALVVDPGSDLPSEQRLLSRALAETRVRAIVLTHAHRDHVAGAPALADREDAPIWAAPATARRLEVDVDRHLDDGQRLDAGETEVRVVHTPGHAPGHICLFHRASASIIAGDLVRSGGTILIDPEDGEMGRYLASLRRTRRLEPRTLLPSHGSPIADAMATLDHYLEHRVARERHILEALRGASRSVHPVDLLPEVYGDAPRRRWPLAVRSLRSHLLHLVDRGLARRTSEGFGAT